MSAGTRLEVDPIACTAHGLCAAWLPERVSIDEWGYPILDPTPLTPDSVRLAQRAADECPVRALRLRSVDAFRRRVHHDQEDRRVRQPL